MTDLLAVTADFRTESADLPDPGEVPALDWIDVAMIDADPLYQRPLDENRVGTILRGFSWKSFGAVVVTPRDGGRFSVSDGQHRVEAAKQHPKVSHVPAVIVQAEDVPAEAAIFVDINKNRKNVTALELFFAQLAAGDGAAELVAVITGKAGIRIPKYASAGMKRNDTIAVAAVQSLLHKHGAEMGEEVLLAVAAGAFAPITANHIKAVEYLLTDPQFCHQITADDVKAALAAVGTSLDGDAKRFAATHHCPLWQGLASMWFQKCRKRRASPAQASAAASNLPAEAAPLASTAPKASPARSAPLAATAWETSRTAAQRVPVTGSIMGDPPAGRSALDQRGQA